MAEDTSAAEALFDQTFGRTMKAQQFIWSFHSYMALGRPSASEAIADKMDRFARDFIASPNFGTEEQQKAALVPLETQVLGATLDTIHNAHVAAEAACIVFAHSLIDAAVLDYCRVLRKAVDAYMKRLANKSLLAKIDVLQTVCKPGSTEIRKGYRFDRARIKAIDDLRIAIIHKDSFVERVPATDDDLAYLWETNLYLSQLITHRYGLLLSPRSMAFLTPPTLPPTSLGAPTSYLATTARGSFGGTPDRLHDAQGP
jgi:hypothetical protein